MKPGNRNVPRRANVPDAWGWAGAGDDPEVRYLRGLFEGRSIDEVQRHFGGGRSIERAGELLYAPRPVFQYYVRAFARFILSAEAAGDPDSAGPFLGLLESRETRDPGSVRIILPALRDAVDFVAAGQTHFAAPVHVYGDFPERVERLYALCER